MDGVDFNNGHINEMSGLSGCVIVHNSFTLPYGTSRKVVIRKCAIQRTSLCCVCVSVRVCLYCMCDSNYLCGGVCLCMCIGSKENVT